MQPKWIKYWKKCVCWRSEGFLPGTDKKSAALCLRFFLASGYSSSALWPYAPHFPLACVRPGALLFGMGISKKGSCFLLFSFYDLLPSLAVLSDDQREEFKPRWQRRTDTKQLDTAPFFCLHPPKHRERPRIRTQGGQEAGTFRFYRPPHTLDFRLHSFIIRIDV